MVPQQGGQLLPGGEAVRRLPGFGCGQLELKAALVHPLVGLQCGGAQRLGHVVAYGVQAVCYGFQSVQVLGQAGSSYSSGHGVGGVEQIAYHHHRQAGWLPGQGDQMGNGRVDQFDHHQHPHAPHQGVLQADIAPNVKGALGVVPPAGVVQLEQCPAAHQLHGAGHSAASEKQQQEVVLQRVQQPQHRHHAKAVNGADRSVQKAAVHQLAAGSGHIHHLAAPAQKGVQQKVGHCIVQGHIAQDCGVEKIHPRASSL